MDTQAFVNAVKSDGGATVSRHGEPLPSHGYWVSDPDGDLVPADTFSASDVESFALAHHDALAQRAAYLGAWVSEGQVYLDVTRHFHTLKVALAVAADNDQLAIWDIRNAREIPVTQAA